MQLGPIHMDLQYTCNIEINDNPDYVQHPTTAFTRFPLNHYRQHEKLNQLIQFHIDFNKQNDFTNSMDGDTEC